MEQLIPIINKLQDVFATVGSQPIDLPQIAVVGSQSVGKSSVLENIVGRDFLPRGNDIVTRRPLILQLINTSGNNSGGGLIERENNKSSDKNSQYEKKNDIENDTTTTTTTTTNTNTNTTNTSEELRSDKNGSNGVDNDNLEWGEFLHKKGKRYYDFNEIRKEIEKETERVAPGRAVSHEPINLKIHSPRVLNLTLVDLPGLTKVPVGNQPHDIDRQINRLVRAFISRPKCLILAVSAATSDLATSDGMQIASQIDPKGVRTLGVITKLDLMDQGTNAMDVLTGKVIPLQLGYVGVVNRSQQHIFDNLHINEALKNEERFFKNHPVYRNIAHMCGIPFLSKKLNQILINHIKTCLPDLKQQINNSIIDLQTELMSYGEPMSAKEKNKGALLLQLISKFSDNVSSAIDGSGVMMLNRQNSPGEPPQRRSSLSNGLTSTAAQDLFGGARILYVFRTEFQQNLSGIKAFDGLSDEFILNSMRNASGIRSSLFIPEMCFENLVKIQIEKLRRPCVNCVEMVYEELKRITGQSQTPEIHRFLKFRAALNECVVEMLKRHLDPCRIFVNQLIDIELAYINTNHPDFISVDDALSESKPSKKAPPPSAPNTQPPNNPPPNVPPTSVRSSPQPQPLPQSQPQPPLNGNGAHDNGSKSKPQQKKEKKQADQRSFPFALLMGRGTSEVVVEEKEKDNKDYTTRPNPSTVPDSHPTTQQPSEQNIGDGQSSNIDHRQSVQSANTTQTNSQYNPHFYGNLPPHLQNRHTTQREQLELLVIKRFIKSYFEIVKKNISDSVPKCIMLMLINLSKERLQQDLALALYREEKFEELLSENPEIAQKRKRANDLLGVLRKALDIINEVRDYKSITTFE